MLSTLRCHGIDVRSEEFRSTLESMGRYHADRNGVTYHRVRDCSRAGEFQCHMLIHQKLLLAQFFG